MFAKVGNKYVQKITTIDMVLFYVDMYYIY